MPLKSTNKTEFLDSTKKVPWVIVMVIALITLFSSVTNLIMIKAGYGDAWDTFANADVQAMAKEITADCKTEYEKAYALFVWMSSNMYYNLDFKAPAEWYSDPSKVMTERMGACEEFAGLYAALCHSVGLRCYVVSGRANDGRGNHAWNLVYADGKKYRVDTTIGANDYQYGRPLQLDSSQYDDDFAIFAMH